MTPTLTSARVAQLLAVAAVSEARPLGEVLRAVPGAPAALAEAGELARALDALGLAPEVVTTALQCPAATAAVARELDALPSARWRAAAVGAPFAWIVPIGLLQAGVLVMVSSKTVPAIEAFGSAGEGLAAQVFVALVLVFAGLAGCAAGLAALAVAPDWVGRVGGWAGSDLRARRAAWRHGLTRGGAPAEVVARLVPGADPTPVPEALQAAAALAESDAAEARATAAVRIGGLGYFLAVAAYALLGLYTALARVPGALW